jgi:16S rRNA (guanine1516-N2)-methyltransferase
VITAATPLCWSNEDPFRRAEALALAKRLGVPECGEGPCDGYVLAWTSARLELRPCGRGGGAVAAEPALRSSSVLARAVGRGRPQEGDLAIDATAGLGADSAALATLGYRVLALERSPLVAALLADGLHRAASEAPEVAARVELRLGEATALLADLPAADLIVIDPMFPRRGKAARTGKGMQALRALLGDDDDAPALLAAAKRAVLRRVIVKRPLRAPPLDGPAPTGAIRGTTVRFDLYPPEPARHRTSTPPSR